MASNMLIVKMIHGTDIRRFTANTVTGLNWGSISKRAIEAFDLEKKKFKVTYVDDEGDKVTISSDEELAEAATYALSCTPAVLRLTVHCCGKGAHREAEDKSPAKDTPPAKDASLAEAMKAAMAAAAKAAKAATDAAPTTANEFTTFVDTIAKQLPAIYNKLPETVRTMLPNAELDIPATIAANIGAAINAHDSFVSPHEAEAKEGVHEGVTCDKSGMCPIVGTRYHLDGHNYDLCEVEYQKLPDKEKAMFRKIPPPGAEPAKDAANEPWGFHPGVSCDRSGMVPIVGMRYKLRGHNYDLCQGEFDKLPDAEKSLYDPIPPPVTNGGAEWGGAVGGAWRGHRGGWGRGWGGAFGKGMGGGAFGKGMGGGKGMGCGKGGGGALAARFVCDVAVFDGTQVTPGTQFTKIWRIKNSGEVAWPPGTRMLFVGGDQMTTEMHVPIGRDSPVMPGEEVDVAVEMTAPKEMGRYLGYWRLAGPHLRRKWGQRVWCHVQVVDPSQPAGAVDVESAVAEFERMKSKLPADDAEEDAEDEGAEEPPKAVATAAAAAGGTATSMAAAGGAMAVAAAGGAMAMSAAATASPADGHDVLMAAAPLATPESSTTDKPTAEAPVEPTADGNLSDDGVLVDDKMIVEAQPAAAGAAAAAAAPAIPQALTGVALVKASLKSMGFLDDVMIEAVVAKHGEDVDACATDLATATEWEPLLDDLAEMGFQNRQLNMTLMLKNNGNVKRTVKDLVEA